MTRTEKPKFTNKKSTALFLIVFLFVFLFVNFGKIALAQDINGGLQYELSDYAPSNLPDASDSCKISLTHPVDTTLSCLLLPASGALVSLAVTLFSWAIDPAKMKAVIDSESVFLAWKTVRDFLNIAFILFLLFSAFCTIFQVSKYSYKNILLNLVLMALLVNFSFPIARFIIDVSNVLMYTMLNGLFPGGAGNLLAGNFADLSQIANVIKPANAGLVQIVMAVIFLFILGVTFLVMALLFVIRIIALAILIIFSPIAFTGSIIPGLQDKASSWWTHLFNYSFFGPIMIFMIYIAFSLANATSVELGKDIATIASKNSNDPGWLASLCKFIIPIIILWIGMGIAKSMSGEAGSAVIGFAENKLKGMGKWASGATWAEKQWGDYKKERDARKEEARWKPGKTFGEKVNNAQDSAQAFLGSSKAQKRMDKRKTDKNKKDIDEGAKDLVDKGATTDTLAQQMNSYFGAPPPATVSDKIDQAKNAAAYLRQDSDERKMHIQNSLTAAGGIVGSDLEHMLNAAVPAGLTGTAAASYSAAQLQAQIAAAAIAGGSTSENDIRKVAAFINSQMKRRVDTGANA